MTTKRDKKDKRKAVKRPKLNKETLKDLEPGDGQKVKGGRGLGATEGASCTPDCSL